MCAASPRIFQKAIRRTSTKRQTQSLPPHSRPHIPPPSLPPAPLPLLAPYSLVRFLDGLRCTPPLPSLSLPSLPSPPPPFPLLLPPCRPVVRPNDRAPVSPVSESALSAACCKRRGPVSALFQLYLIEQQAQLARRQATRAGFGAVSARTARSPPRRAASCRGQRPRRAAARQRQGGHQREDTKEPSRPEGVRPTEARRRLALMSL